MSPEARVVTKGGMARTDGGWTPDGRARSILADCEASLAALDGRVIDLYLLHAPDPRVEWTTSVRALARLVDEGLVRRVGVCNVNRTQLDVALEHAPIAAVQVALSRFDDAALRGGLVDRCADAGLALIAHSPLGGTRRAARLTRDPALNEIAQAHGATEAEVALAWLLGLGPNVVAVPGARRPETARSAARAASLELGADEQALVGRARPRSASRRRRTGDVVLVMGIPGAGKSRVAQQYVERGYLRLNRDERGGTLRQLADALDDALAAGAREIVLDNTYLTRAWRNDVVATAASHGLAVRCMWLDTPLAQAQVNLVERLLDRFGRLLAPPELKAAARQEPGRAHAHAADAGASRARAAGRRRGLRKHRAGAVRAGGTGGTARRVRGRRRSGAASRVARRHSAASPLRLAARWVDRRPRRPRGFDLGARRDGGLRAPGRPPTCWCRPPLPGLVLEFARRRDVDPARSVLVGASPAHRTLATALDAKYVDASD